MFSLLYVKCIGELPLRLERAVICYVILKASFFFFFQNEVRNVLYFSICSYIRLDLNGWSTGLLSYYRRGDGNSTSVERKISYWSGKVIYNMAIS
jgi:hypothetical protein